MELVGALVKVLVGAFVLFTVARVAYGQLVPHAGWAWVTLLGVLAVCNMLFHRWMGSTINPPFFTAVLFGVTLMGIAPQQSEAEGEVSQASRWFRRGIAAVAIGSVLGWLSYAEVGTVASDWLPMADTSGAA